VANNSAKPIKICPGNSNDFSRGVKNIFSAGAISKGEAI
jgi:hypothetical protein